jgi:hypothetical protein
VEELIIMLGMVSVGCRKLRSSSLRHFLSRTSSKRNDCQHQRDRQELERKRQNKEEQQQDRRKNRRGEKNENANANTNENVTATAKEQTIAGGKGRSKGAG